jgi:hypothetical protein
VGALAAEAKLQALGKALNAVSDAETGMVRWCPWARSWRRNQMRDTHSVNTREAFAGQISPTASICIPPTLTIVLSEAQALELSKVVHRHAIQLEKLLDAEEFWTHDLHVPVATQLRVLLCDKDLPGLLILAKHRGISLRVWGPKPPGSGLRTQALFHWSALVASWTPDGGGHEMSIEEYLDTGVAVIPINNEGRAFSPRQLIKWVANKEGGAHFSFDKPATFNALRGSEFISGDAAIDSFLVKQIVYFIGIWTHTAIGTCLGLHPRNDVAPPSGA